MGQLVVLDALHLQILQGGRALCIIVTIAKVNLRWKGILYLIWNVICSGTSCGRLWEAWERSWPLNIRPRCILLPGWGMQSLITSTLSKWKFPRRLRYAATGISTLIYAQATGIATPCYHVLQNHSIRSRSSQCHETVEYPPPHSSWRAGHEQSMGFFAYGTFQEHNTGKPLACASWPVRPLGGTKPCHRSSGWRPSSRSPTHRRRPRSLPPYLLTLEACCSARLGAKNSVAGTQSIQGARPRKAVQQGCAPGQRQLDNFIDRNLDSVNSLLRGFRRSKRHTKFTRVG
uniref:Uncharacterized protein n=1 Tax=Spironucleus salmonicida TaxID=348837 RepID=V6LLH5_9EUKA|eukprot:EST41544.1 Hypothetical protein SS50377_18881 [Spironucleus salmonicida]